MRAAASLLLVAWLGGSALAGPETPSFGAIAGGVGERSHDRSCALMEAWIAAHPRDTRAGRGLIWMGDLRLLDGRRDAARAYFERAVREHAGSEWALAGEKGLADLDLAQHRFAAAIERYQSLARSGSPSWSFLGRAGLAAARAQRFRFDASVALAAFLAALAGARAFLARRAGGRLWPPPAELTYTLPVFLLLLAGALAQPPAEARAIVTVAGSAPLLLWATGAHLRARPPRLARCVLEALLGAAQAFALVYIAIVANGLWDKLIVTVAVGPD